MAQPSRKRFLVYAVAVLLPLASTAIVLLCLPVVHIDQSTADKILPGTSFRNAEAIIGGPPGTYDGITSYVSGVPFDKEYKWYKPQWVGNEGVLILELDNGGRVAAVNFWAGPATGHSIPKFVWERWTRNAFGPWPY
jgi:hypothetical protein